MMQLLLDMANFQLLYAITNPSTLICHNKHGILYLYGILDSPFTVSYLTKCDLVHVGSRFKRSRYIIWKTNYNAGENVAK